MLKGKVSLILLIIISALFIVGFTKLSGAAQAQINGFGDSCILNTGDCIRNEGDMHISDKISSLNYVGLSSSDFAKALNNTFLTANDPTIYPDPAQMCASPAMTGSIIRVNYGNTYLPDNLGVNDPTDNLTPYNYNPGSGGSTQTTFYVARICPSGKTAIASTKGDGAAGCCPGPDYRYVGSFDETKIRDHNTYACCKVKSGSRDGDKGYPVYYDSELNSCYDTFGQTEDNFYDPDVNTIDYTGISQPISGGENAIGNGLGAQWNTTYKADRKGANQICDLPKDASGKQIGCTLFPDDGSSVPGSLIQSGGKSFIVADANALTDAAGTNLKCQKCYSSGEPIIVENLGNSGATPNLILCDPSSLDLIRRTPLIDNSVAVTMAALKATDPANRDFIIQCTSSGGIPTAIGCVDASPLGIITGLIRIALGVIGGVALLQLILVGIQYQRGDEAKIKEARDRLIATLTGVAVLVFSVLILRILGVNVLDVIPRGSI